MKALKKQEIRALKAAETLEYTITYIPGLIESQDQYCASHNALFEVNCYGSSKQSALNSAIKEASFLLLDHPDWIRDLLKP